MTRRIFLFGNDGRPWLLRLCAIVLLCGIGQGSVWGITDDIRPTDLQRARIYLAAGDFQRAIEACRHEIDRHPSAEAYLYLTYVYHALDAYVESLAKADRWVSLDLLYLSLVTGKSQDFLDPPDVLTRIVKELIQSGARQQADVTAAMAARLDPAVVAVVWPQQTAWRKAKPDGWWLGVPPEWSW